MSKPDGNPVYVTKTFLPPLEEYTEYLKRIWASGQLTNQGPLLQEFEEKLAGYLQIENQNLHFVSNGTIALQVALQALDITEGEVITTPFTYVATTSAILWQRCKPVYVDIDPETLCIDATKIEAAITKDTKAIMPVHVFGNPCDVEAIELIAKKHNLKVIYDAAHAFGVTYKGKSLLDCGDISICSFHSTKLFHTIEGGCIVAKDVEISKKVNLIKRFGHNNDDHLSLGINAKSSEFQAAMGLANLKYVYKNIQKRKNAVEIYDALLTDRLQRPKLREGVDYNYAYYPILLESEEKLKDVLRKLEREGIFSRRYFYPSLNTLPYLNGDQECPISENVASRILCLPLYVGLEEKTINQISEVIIK